MGSITKCVEIGNERSMTASASFNYLSFIKFNPQPDATLKPEVFTLSARSVEKIHQNLENISAAFLQHKTGEGETYSLHLGNNVFLSITKGVRCVGIRKFFRPKHDQALLLPGKYGTAFKLSEFETLMSIWTSLYEVIDTVNISVCSHTKDHEGCLYCFY